MVRERVGKIIMLVKIIIIITILSSILSMQTAAFRANVNIKCEFPDAPFTAEVHFYTKVKTVIIIIIMIILI